MREWEWMGVEKQGGCGKMAGMGFRLTILLACTWSNRGADTCSARGNVCGSEIRKPACFSLDRTFSVPVTHIVYSRDETFR